MTLRCSTEGEHKETRSATTITLQRRVLLVEYKRPTHHGNGISRSSHQLPYKTSTCSANSSSSPSPSWLASSPTLSLSLSPSLVSWPALPLPAPTSLLLLWPTAVPMLLPSPTPPMEHTVVSTADPSTVKLLDCSMEKSW